MSSLEISSSSDKSEDSDEYDRLYLDHPNEKMEWAEFESKYIWLFKCKETLPLVEFIENPPEYFSKVDDDQEFPIPDTVVASSCIAHVLGFAPFNRK